MARADPRKRRQPSLRLSGIAMSHAVMFLLLLSLLLETIGKTTRNCHEKNEAASKPRQANSVGQRSNIQTCRRGLETSQNGNSQAESPYNHLKPSAKPFNLRSAVRRQATRTLQSRPPHLRPYPEVEFRLSFSHRAARSLKKDHASETSRPSDSKYSRTAAVWNWS